MKKQIRNSLLILILFTLVRTDLFAQISLGPQDFGNIGDEVELYFDSTYIGPQSAGNPGAAQIWNFGLSSNTPDTLRFVDPNSTPYGSDFPASNIALEEGISYTYLNQSLTDIKVYGFNLDLDTFFPGASILVDPPITLIQFPATYGDNYSSSGTGSVTFPFQDTFDIGGNPTYVDSVRVEFNVQQIDSINGYGILNIDTSSNQALRIESWQNIGFSLFAKVEIFPTVFIWVPIPIPILPNIVVRSVNYLGNGFDYPLLSFELDSAGDIIGNSFQKNPVVNSIDDASSLGLIKSVVYPNPASDKLFFDLQYGTQPVEILDSHGREIFKIQDQQIEKGLDISTLSKGVYFLRMTTPNGQLVFERFIKN